MQDNPYMGLLQTMSRQAQAVTFPMVRTGVVVSVWPLAVNTGGITLSGADLLINTELLPRTRELKLTEPEGEIEAAATGAANGTLILDLEQADILCTAVEQNGALVSGDRVVLLSEDNNTFIVIGKVVNA